VKLVDQWGAIEAGLPAGWSGVRLDVVVETAGRGQPPCSGRRAQGESAMRYA
jgi:hypothetical protein